MPQQRIAEIIYKTARGLAHMHKHGFFHRDIKPENIMVDGDKVKLCDFGLARRIRSRPPFTDYISTRWYRAPELLLKSVNYSSPIDIFALGLIMVELYLLKPLFAGTNELDQLYKICNVLGTPTQDWREGYVLAQKLGFEWPQKRPIFLSEVIPRASLSALKLLNRMLKFDPK